MPPREWPGSRWGSSVLRLLLVVAPVVGRPAHDVLGPGRGLGGELAHDLVAEVVVHEVLGGDRAHRRSEVQDAPSHRRELRVVAAPLPGRLDVRDRVLAVVRVLDAPAAVVQPDHRRREPGRVELGVSRHLVDEVDRPLAERDALDRRVVRHGLGHEVHGVRVVEEPRVRADLLHLRADVLEDGDRPERHEESARPLRLLADHAVVERDPLVLGPGTEAAGAKRREDGVAVAEGSLAVGGGRDREVDAAGAGHLLGERPDQLEPVGVEVDQHDLRPVELGAVVVDERGHRPRTAGRASADVCQLDPGHCLPVTPLPLLRAFRG